MRPIAELTRRLALTLTLAAAGVAVAAPAHAALPGAGVTVQPVKSTIAEETFQTLVVMKGLEALGYKVLPIKEVDYLPGHIAVANGDATFMADHWDPQHDAFYEKSGGDAKLWRDNNFIPGGVQGYLVDKKTADKYHITNLGQLKDPRLARLFDTNGDGRANLVGCIPGWFCSQVIDHELKAYGLTKTVEQVQGEYAVLIADTIARYRAGEPVLYYGWIPYWLSDVLVPGKDVVWLQVPFSAMPNKAGGKDLDTALPDGRNYGFQVNTQRIVANRKFIEANPAARKFFEEVTIPVADVTAENRAMHEGANKPADIKRHADGWIKAHQKEWDRWIADAKAAAKP